MFNLIVTWLLSMRNISIYWKNQCFYFHSFFGWNKIIFIRNSNDTNVFFIHFCSVGCRKHRYPQKDDCGSLIFILNKKRYGIMLMLILDLGFISTLNYNHPKTQTKNDLDDVTCSSCFLFILKLSFFVMFFSVLHRQRLEKLKQTQNPNKHKLCIISWDRQYSCFAASFMPLWCNCRYWSLRWFLWTFKCI